MSEETPKGIPEGTQLPVRWVGVDEAPVLFANQAIGQIGQQGEVVLTFGQLIPPVFVGTPDQIVQQAKEWTHVPTQTLARVVITRAGLDQLVEILNQTLDNYEQAQHTLQEMQARMDNDIDG